jgi:hypothetical protein
MSSVESLRPARLLVAFSLHGQLELTLCRYLIGDRPVELSGLLIEDTRLVAHTGSSLAREIVLSGLERRFDPPTLERQLRARAAAVRRRFEAGAAEFGWRHRFHVVRGELQAELLRAAGAADVVIVDAASSWSASSIWTPAELARLARSPLSALLVVREGWVRGREIVAVLSDEAEDPFEAGSPLDTAVRLANETGSALGVVLAGRAEVLARRLEAALRAEHGTARFRGILTVPDIGAAAAALRRRNPRLLVLPRTAADDEALVDKLLTDFVSSLLWLGAGARGVGGAHFGNKKGSDPS